MCTYDENEQHIRSLKAIPVRKGLIQCLSVPVAEKKSVRPTDSALPAALYFLAGKKGARMMKIGTPLKKDGKK